MKKLVIAVGFAVGAAAVAGAQPMMCGTGIVDPGDTMERVLMLCGRPLAARSWTETVPAGDDWEGYVTADQIPMAEWLYQKTPDSFAYKVVFQNGVVQEIKD